MADPRAIPRAPLGSIAVQLLHNGAGRLDLRRSHEGLLADLGPVVSQGVGRLRVVLLFGPDANRMVLLDREKRFSSRIPWMQIMGKIFPNGLLLRDGEEHLLHRRIMFEAFTMPVLRAYAEQMSGAIESSLEGLAGPRKAFSTFKELTLDIATATFMGETLGADARAMREAFEAMVAASMPGLRHPLPFGRQHRGIQGRRYMLDYLRQRLPTRREGGGDDLFSRLSTARTEEGETFSDEDVLDHMSFLMMAAHDTTTSTLTSLTWELARNPRWQERVRSESLARDGAHLDFAELDELESLTWCMRETLRMYPPLPVIPRTALAELEWEGHRIPRGTMISLSPILTHYMPQWWDEPERWDPERFSPARAEDRRHSHSWVPFGGGLHLCLGKRFAETQVRQIMHQLVRRYRWSVPDGYRMPVQPMPISKPTDGLPIELEALQ